MKSKASIAAIVGTLAWAVISLTPAAAAAESGCSLEPTSGTVTRALDGRTYLVNAPPGLNGPDVPLLLSLHGFGSNGSQVEEYTGWTPFAKAHRFIVAYPQGQPSEYSGAWDPYSASSPDVPFLRSVVQDISSRWCVDQRHVHIDGWSNGAVMSQRMACAAPEVFASAVSYGGGTPTLSGFAAPCRPSRPISVGLFAGQYDFTYAGLAANASEWRAVNGCAPTPTRTTDPYGSTETYACAAGTTVLARVVSDTSHNWPSGAQGEDQRTRMWEFLMANPRP